MKDFIEYARKQPLVRLFASASIVSAGAMLAQRQSNQTAIYYALTAFSGMCISRYIANPCLVNLKKFKEGTPEYNILQNKFELSRLTSFALLYSATTLYVLPTVSQIMAQDSCSKAVTAIVSATTLVFTSNVVSALLTDSTPILPSVRTGILSNFVRLSVTSNYGDEYRFLGGGLGAFAASNLEWAINHCTSEKVRAIPYSPLNLFMLPALSVACIHDCQGMLSNIAPVSISNTLLFNAANIIVTNIIVATILGIFSERLSQKTEQGRG